MRFRVDEFLPSVAQSAKSEWLTALIQEKLAEVAIRQSRRYANDE
ncbi:hypothetical protein [Thermostichus vulcanus]|nr:hypothetical protein [Thermostichus vulcanus]